MSNNEKIYRPAAASDIRDPTVLNAMIDIVTECYHRGAHDSRSCIPLREFARELSDRTQINWSIDRLLFLQALNAMVDRRSDCILSACVVSSARFPIARYFRVAIARELISKKAGVYERIGCWRRQYKLARKICRELKRDAAVAFPSEDHSESEHCAGSLV